MAIDFKTRFKTTVKNLFAGFQTRTPTYSAMSEALKRTESRFRKVVESNLIGTFFYHHDGRISDANNRFLEMLGYTREDLLAGKLSWIQMTPPEWVEEDNRQLLKTQVVSYEKAFLRKDGSKISIFLAAADFDSPSDEGVAFVLDLTEQKQAQEALMLSEQRNLLSAKIAGIGAWEWSFKTNLVHFSENSWKLFGFEGKPRPITGQDLAERIVPKDMERITELHLEAIRDRKSVHDELRVILPDGNLRWIESRGTPIFGDNGEPLMFLGAHFDITQKKQSEEALRTSEMQMEKALHEAQNANQMKDEFLAMLSHELRTPLNAILGWSELMQTADRNSDLFNRAIETVHRNARLQTEMINDLLDMARILNGKFSIALKNVDLGDIIMDVVESCRLNAQVKQINVRVDIDVEDTHVLGDGSRLQQIFWNLLTNALKFTPRGGLVLISAKREDSYVVVRVDDSGEGIPPDFLPYIFDRFRQADASTTRRHGGLGLGLAIVRHLVELHGGAISAQSLGTGRGSSFQIRLPVAPISSATAGPDLTIAGVSDPTAIDYEKQFAGKNILIVDDVKDSLEFVGEVLGRVGANVTLANSGPEALAQIEQHHFDLMLTDLGMPEMDGFALLKCVRSFEKAMKHPRMPIVALTAYARGSDYSKTKAAGFDAHLAKPISPAWLFKTLAMILSKRESSEPIVIESAPEIVQNSL